MVCKQQDCANSNRHLWWNCVAICWSMSSGTHLGPLQTEKNKSSGVESGPLQEKALFQQLGIVLNFLGTAFHSQRHLMRVDRTNWAKSPLQSKDQCVLKQSAPKSNWWLDLPAFSLLKLPYWTYWSVYNTSIHVYISISLYHCSTFIFQSERHVVANWLRHVLSHTFSLERKIAQINPVRLGPVSRRNIMLVKSR